MKKYLLFPLLFLIFACSSEEMKCELQGYDPLVGSWDVIGLDTNELRDKVIYRPEGTWISLLSVVSDREETGYWLNISENKDYNSINQSYSITFKEQNNEINGVYNNDFNSFVYEIEGEIIKYVKNLE